jgi:hypothetical protein
MSVKQFFTILVISLICTACAMTYDTKSKKMQVQMNPQQAMELARSIMETYSMRGDSDKNLTVEIGDSIFIITPDKDLPDRTKEIQKDLEDWGE